MKCITRLSDVQPEDEEHEHAEAKQIVDVVFVIRLGQLENLADGVGEHGMCGVKLIIHRPQELVLLLHLRPYVY